VEEIEVDRPKAGEVLLRVEAAAICHSDRHNVTGHRVVRRPCVVGHEGAGVVEAVGEGVTRVVPGDRVMLSFVPSCGHCHACLRGRTLDCERGIGAPPDGTAVDGTYRLHSLSGEDLGQAARIGAFSRHTVVSQEACLKVPEGLPMASLALLSCGVTTGLGAALHQARIGLGETVVVVGVGGVGTAAVQGAVIAGAGRVIAVDLNERRLESARRFGATDALDAREGDWVDGVRALTSGRGADSALLCIDHIEPRHIAQLMACIRPGGTGVMVGSSELGVDHIEVSPAAMVSQHKTLRGTIYGSENPQRDALQYLDLYRAGRLRLDEMVTATYALGEINEGFADLVAGRNVRGVVEMAR
jgi:S-(hydroxymethyl)glutathione dehydrogenase/alcohol dehydrogenase